MNLNTTFRKLLCFIGRHSYYTQRVFSNTSRKVGCRCCNKSWAMNDSVRAFVPWDGDFENLYRTIGQWPGREL